MSSKTRNAIIKCAQDHNGKHEGFGQGELKTYRSDSRAMLSGGQLRAVFTNNKGEDKADRLYVGGMCHTMCLYWLAHKTGSHGKSFWDWIRPEGNFDEAAANVIVTKTIMYKARGQGAAAQGIVGDANFDDRFFLKYKLKKTGKELDGGFQIGYAMFSFDTQYCMIFYGGGEGGHACAFYTDSSRVVYFDPNYGEFSFYDMFNAFEFYNDYLIVSKYVAKYPRMSGLIYRYC